MRGEGIEQKGQTMAHDAPQAASPSKLGIRNIGLLLSGVKAMAIFAQRSFWTLRPGGVKIHAGAPVIENEMVEDDFKELAAAGVKLLGEVGLGGVKDGPTARKMVGWARKYGIQSTIHTGGPSIPGSGLIDKDVVLEADTAVIRHITCC